MKLSQTRRAAGLLLQASAAVLLAAPTIADELPSAPPAAPEKPAAADEKPTQQRVEVRVESRSTSDGGKRNQVTQGRVTVIGPDGVKREYDLRDPEGRALILRMDGGVEALGLLEGTGKAASGEKPEEKNEGLKEPAVRERVMIGVACDEAPLLLRRHLKLDAAGLVVQSVSESSPAADAGVEPDDVLVSINDQQLQTREQLVEAIAGLEGQAVRLQIIRNGDPLQLTVTPRKMPVPDPVISAADDQKLLEEGAFPAIPGIKLRRFFPGVIIDEQFPTDQEAMESLLKKSRQAAEAARRFGDPAAAAANADTQELSKQLEQLRRELEAIREQLQSEKKSQPE
jgi:C-terminal processing protease CtpA/Prc